ncbi:hypothetical protein [Tautonia marina]|uniref:hypothetical protein n=1 Tax=Tautonia marina TaxID=2653855 RepID=UPI0012610A1A|nr:hypothetical protein [Tautonia marina]
MWDEHERFVGRFVRGCGWSIVMIGAAIALVSLVFKTPAVFLVYVNFLALLGLIGLTYVLMMLGVTAIANGLCQGVRSIWTRHSR